MADEPQSERTPDDGDIFGQLPSARPGVRSPRRDSAKEAPKRSRKAKPKSHAASRQPSSSAGRRPATPRPRGAQRAAGPRRPASAPPPTEPEAQQAPAGRRGGVEDVAWAGITVAAEAATLGVRLLGRAVEAVRKPSDRE